MSDYAVLLGDEALAYLAVLDDKSTRICKNNLGKLAANPYPGTGRGDKEKLVIDGHEQYRLHIGRTHTAFYTINEDDSTVRVHEITDIDDAHKRYGF